MLSVVHLLAGSGGPNDPPPRCFRPNAEGELASCTYSDGRWRRSFDTDQFVGVGDAPDPGGAFAVLFVIALLVGIAITFWKVTTARRMARESGMSESDATTMALLTDDGFEATYLAANLRGQRPTPVPGPGGGRSVAERLRELDKLRDEGLVDASEHERARRAILDEL